MANEQKMIVDCISDLHGYYPKLEGGDLLIVAGDLTARDTDVEYFEFFNWISKKNYKKKIVIAGNHDNRISNHINFPNHFEYLCDSGTEFEGLKIWGTPWTKRFPGMNPHCMAFTVDTEKELYSKFSLIPDDVDILISHGPPCGVCDKTVQGEHAGSMSLCLRVANMKIPKLWCWGHIHEAYGERVSRSGCRLVNCSHVNERYQPVNKPIRVVL